MKNVAVRLTLCIATVLGAFFLERLFAEIAGPRVPVLPLVLLAAIVWFPALPFSWRLWTAGFTGLVTDAFGAAPFGTTIIALLITGLLAEILRSIVAARDRGWGHASVSAGLALAVFALRPIAGAVIQYAARLLS